MTESLQRTTETPSNFSHRPTFQPYAHVIELLDAACAMLKEHVENAETPDDERMRLHGSMDSIRFERNIISSFEAAKVVHGNRKRL